jgi:RND family efflux transporter MFP subunit
MCRLGRSFHVHLAALLWAVLALGGCSDAPPPDQTEQARPVKVVRIEAEADVLQRSYPARVSAGEEAELAFRRPGTLQSLPVRAGDAVVQGQELARLDPRDFETALAEARSAYEAEQARLALLRAGTRPEEVAQAAAALSAAQAQQRNAATDYERKRRMLERGLISQAEFERAETAREVTSADVERVTQELAKARAGARPEEIAAQEARVVSVRSVVEQAEAALDDTVLSAPFDGLVSMVTVDNFTEVQAKQPILLLQDISAIRVTLQVPEAFIRHADRGRLANFAVRFPGEGDVEHPATFREISAQADPQTQTFAVTLEMPALPGINLLSGMTAEVTVRLAAADGGGQPGRILVPVEAIASGAGTAPMVWVIDAESRRLVRRAITTGAMSGNLVEITSGLVAGEEIVVAGLASLRENMLVRSIEP